MSETRAKMLEIVKCCYVANIFSRTKRDVLRIFVTEKSSGTKLLPAFYEIKDHVLVLQKGPKDLSG